MLIYNSRKRKEWTEQQENKLLAVLEQAHEAAARGTATEEQLRLLKIEEVVDSTERERAAKGGTFQRAKSYWYSMYSNERPIEPNAEDTPIASDDDENSDKGGMGVLKAVKEATEGYPGHQQGESRTLEAIRANYEGGPFDRASAAAADRARTLPRDWLSWIKRE